ncbi:MAG: molybdate ABC transporter substrate-binding protein [Candidatus Omnitrophota bacterium]
MFILFVSLIFFGDKTKPEFPRKPTLIVYAGAGLMKPMEEICQRFGKDNRVEVRVNYGGSGELLGQLSMGRTGDVFVPGADKYIDDAKKNKWIIVPTITRLVKHVPVIAVGYGNPRKIKGLDDLMRPEITLALGDPNACAIGRLAQDIFIKNGINSQIKANTKVVTPTVNQLLMYLLINQVDAAVIWEDMVSWSESRQKLSIVRINQEQNIIKTVSAAVISGSLQPRAAEKLIKFMASDQGYAIWGKWGFGR